MRFAYPYQGLNNYTNLSHYFKKILIKSKFSKKSNQEI